MTVNKSKQGKANRRKGYRAENQVVNIFKDNKINAKRTAHAGIPGDITIYLDKKRKAEIKFRKAIPKVLWEWQEDVDFTVIKRPHKPFLVQMTLDSFIEMVKALRDDKQKK